MPKESVNEKEEKKREKRVEEENKYHKKNERDWRKEFVVFCGICFEF